MTSSLGSKPVISRITLALLEDSGWYLPDYSYASKLSWGFHQGCHFASSNCKNWLEYAQWRKISPSPFCDINVFDGKKEYYDVDGNQVVECHIHNYTCDLPYNYQVHKLVCGPRIDCNV